MAQKAGVILSLFLFSGTAISAELPGTATSGVVMFPQVPQPNEFGDSDEPESSSSPDSPAEGELDEAVRELEDLRVAEEAAVDKGSLRAEEVFQAMRRAGPSSPLHQRWNDALGSWPLPMFSNENELEASALAEIGSFDIEKAKNLYDIPVEMTPQVADYIRFFQTTGRKHYVKWLSRSSRWMPMMRRVMKEAGLPEDTVYLSMIESGFSPMAYSWAKASGLWQFIPSTGKRFGLAVDFWQDQRRNPLLATTAAAKYLKELYSEFGDWRLAWAAYNAGEGSLRRAIRAENTTDFWKIIEGRSLHKETKHYVPKLMAAALIAKNPKSFGFQDAEICPEPPWEYEEVPIPQATDLEVVARAASISLEKIQELNPELRRWCTPPSLQKGDFYPIRLPAGAKEEFVDNFSRIAPENRLSFAVHRVRSGDTLSRIASRYGTVPEAIMRMNSIRDSRRLKLQAELVIPVPRGGSREMLAQAARRQGFRAAPSEQEIPAASVRRSRVATARGVRYVKEGRRTKVIYGVSDGDSLWGIGRNFGVTVEQLKNWNGLRGRRAKLQIGQELVLYPVGKHIEQKESQVVAVASSAIKERKSLSSSVASKKVHVVEAGDTLWSVAQRYKVTVENLRRWNRIQQHRKLQIGMSITVVAP